MTRRSFLKNIAGAIAVLALPVAVKKAAEYQAGKCVVEDPFPQRFEYRGGRWHEVPPRIGDGEINKAYLDAAYELTFFKWEMPRIFPVS